MPNLRSQDRYILQDLGIEKVATLRADININYASPSPDGRTLLVVGDTNEVFLYDMRLGGQLEYREMGVVYASPSPSLSAAWAPNSRVFAVAGQEGLVSVFDVRMMGGDRPRRGKESQSPTMLYQFGPNGDRRRLPRNISHSSFISTDHSEPDMMYPFLYGRSGHGLYSISSAADFSFSASRSSPSSLSSSSASSRGNSGAHRSTLFTGGSMGHGSSHGLQERDKHALRVVKFSQSGVLDLMAYSEHATHVHIIDARTFQSRQTLRVCPPGIDSHITGLCFNFDDGQEDGPGPNEPWADMGGEKLLVGLENSVLEYSIKDTSRRSFAIGDMA
ncbi:hypothetical protein BZG36_05124 [Bifiguratus adelaidae]|uniref:DUF2415 domain-containing protein n=1 Tax=Bifiguratus adelaidae TaxID=1938954 RepID=A0A261XU97_9FUNG|nr:hypothetical protein BZG36_05124 [Bifiguratus adelaidae]